MANNRLTTRIILRNDSTAGWQAVADSADYKLLKGEVGIEFIYANEGDVIPSKTKIKIGDGQRVWGELPYFGGDECQVFEATVAKDASHADSITAAVGTKTVNKGDIAIVKEAVIAADKLGSATQQYQYTAYVYGETSEGAAWKAMDGNYSADNVYFSDDMMVTKEVGYITLTAGQGKIPSKGKNLTQVFEAMYVKEANPKKTDPAVSFDSVTAGRYETGTKVTPTWDANFSAGSYTYGPATGVTVSSWEISDTAGNTASTETGSFSEIQVTDSTSYKITAKANHTAGSVPVTNKGNPYTGVQISAGNKSATSNAITGARKAFYGAFVTPIALNSESIRNNCTAKWHDDDVNSNTYCSGDGYTLTIPEGATQVVVCLYGKTLKNCYDVAAFGTDIQLNNAFVIQETGASIAGANNYSPVTYNTYVYSVPGGLGANTYHIKIG